MAIHQDSARCDAHFVAVNCGAIYRWSGSDGLFSRRQATNGQDTGYQSEEVVYPVK